MAWAKLNLEAQDYLIKKCKECGADIVWLKSKKGNPYPVNFKGLIDVQTNDFHKCREGELWTYKH